MSSASPTTSFVADTMAIVLWLENRRLPSRVQPTFQQARIGQTTIFVPGIVFAEVLYLHERGRIRTSVADVTGLIATSPGFQELPLSGSITAAAVVITDVPELHDRLIAASGLATGLAVLTNDPVIQSSRWLTTLW